MRQPRRLAQGEKVGLVACSRLQEGDGFVSVVLNGGACFQKRFPAGNGYADLKAEPCKAEMRRAL